MAQAVRPWLVRAIDALSALTAQLTGDAVDAAPLEIMDPALFVPLPSDWVR